MKSLANEIQPNQVFMSDINNKHAYSPEKEPMSMRPTAIEHEQDEIDNFKKSENEKFNSNKLFNEHLKFDGPQESEQIEEEEHVEEYSLATIIQNLQSPAGSKKSSTSNSTNTSPQLPSFSSSVSSTAINVPTTKPNTFKHASSITSSINCTSQVAVDKQQLSVESVESAITFTLSDDEISDDSNASHRNMKTVENFSSMHQNNSDKNSHRNANILNQTADILNPSNDLTVTEAKMDGDSLLSSSMSTTPKLTFSAHLPNIINSQNKHSANNISSRYTC